MEQRRQQQQKRGQMRRGNFQRRPREEAPVIPLEERWTPKTQLGRDVLAKKYTSMKDILHAGHRIMEPEITEFLITLFSKQH